MSTSTQLQNLPIINPKDLYIGERIGTGGFCVVHSASMRSVRRSNLAVKCLRFDKEPTDVAEADLLREATVLASLRDRRHRNIIRVHGISTIGNVTFLVMDRLENNLFETLHCWKAHWKERPPSSRNVVVGWKRRIKDVALGLASGLRHLHKHGIVHRDIKPGNIGFDKDGNVVLYDFGLAKIIQGAATLPSPASSPRAAPLHESLESLNLEDYYLQDPIGEEQSQTTTPSHSSSSSESTIACSGQAGTVKYMAPEIAQCDKYGVSADVYSFGILLWELVTLRTVYKGFKTRQDVLRASVSGQRPSLRALPPHKKLRKLVNACWHHDPSKRPSAGKIHAKLKAILNEEPPASHLESSSSSPSPCSVSRSTEAPPVLCV